MMSISLSEENGDLSKTSTISIDGDMIEAIEDTPGPHRDTTSFKVSIDEMYWMIGYLRNKSSLLIPQIVTVMKSHRAKWDRVKDELVKL